MRRPVPPCAMTRACSSLYRMASTTVPATRTDLATKVSEQDQQCERCAYCNGGDLHRASCWAVSVGVPLWRTHCPHA